MPPNSKPRQPRVDRDVVLKVQEDENQHLWALSYADFLMALLAFFILFFSIDEPKRDNFMRTIAVQFASNGLSGDRNPAAMEAGFDKDFMDHVQKLNVTAVVKGHDLLIEFPLNFFSAGKYTLNSTQRATMNQLLSVLKPYSGKLNIYFEGHTDNQPVVRSRTAYMKDNFNLSTLRASSALEYAKKSGFEEKHLFIAGMSSNVRNSRTLSLRLEAREGTEQ
ncbi:MAG: flagellar motor protein MotB [Bdellovibrio sp.]